MFRRKSSKGSHETGKSPGEETKAPHQHQQGVHTDVLTKSKRAEALEYPQTGTTLTIQALRERPQVPSEPQAEVSFTKSASAKVDYSLIKTVTPETYLQKISTKLGDARDRVLAALEHLDEDSAWWLMHALHLYTLNTKALPEDFDHVAAVFRLIDRAKSSETMPGDPRQVFERDVLNASGWTAATLVGPLVAPSGQTAAELRTIYNPSLGAKPGAQQDDDQPQKSRLDRKVLQEELLPPLLRLIADELTTFPPREGPPPERESPERYKKTATYVQQYLGLMMGPYPTANPVGPFSAGYVYADHLRSTEELGTEVKDLVGWLRNRAELIGRRGPFEKAGYNGALGEDKRALAELLVKLLDDPKVEEDVAFCRQHTPTHSAELDSVYLIPVFPVKEWGPRSHWRWTQTRDLIHEFVHRLAHPAFKDWAAKIEDPQILKEGFVDMITADVFQKLVKDLGRKPDMAEHVLGQAPPYDPPDDALSRTGYDKAGKAAETIRSIVGTENVYAAYFLGATHLIGLT